MDPHELVRRLQAVPETATRLSSGIDLDDPVQIDRLAGPLLARFRDLDDIEALGLLADLTHERLVEASESIVREVGVAVAPLELVAGFFASLVTDLRRARPEEGHFLQRATESLVAAAEDAVAAFALGPAGLGTPADPVVEPERAAGERSDGPAPSLADLGRQHLDRVRCAFHRLDRSDRRLLMAIELDGHDYDALAAAFDLPRDGVARRLAGARQRLSTSIGHAYGGMP